MPVKLDVMARISDTTGALMAGNYADKKCRIGVILGIELLLTFNAQLAFFFHNIVILADRFFFRSSDFTLNVYIRYWIQCCLCGED